jgi:hypothetical protein
MKDEEQNMNIQLQRTFSRRVGCCITCVIPADLLCADPFDQQDNSSLRVDASRDQLSYIQVSRLMEEALYLARVAATPENVANGYTVLLTEEQLFFALPWDTRLEGKPSDCILRQLQAHALELQPHLQAMLTLERGIDRTGQEASLIPLDTVEVSVEDLQDAIMPVRTLYKNTVGNGRGKLFHLQQAFLRAMVDVLMDQLYQGQAQASALALKRRCVQLLQIQRLHRHKRRGQLVNVVPCFSAARHQIMWQLTVGLPAMYSLAA